MNYGALPALAPGDSGAQVAQLQAALTNAGYDTGGITGTYDQSTAGAVAALQSAAGIPTSGSMDTATWQALATSSAQSSAVVPMSLQEAQGALGVQPATQPQAAPAPQGITPSLGGGLSPTVVMVALGAATAAAAAYFYFSSRGPKFSHDEYGEDYDEFVPPGRRGCDLSSLRGRRRSRR